MHLVMAAKKKPAAKKKAAEKKDPTLLKEVEEIFQRDYAGTWDRRIAESPHIKSQLLDLIYVGKQLAECRRIIAEMIEKGTDFTYTAPNGVMGDHPILKRQDKWRMQEKNLVKQLNVDLARKDRNRSTEGRFAKFRKKKQEAKKK